MVMHKHAQFWETGQPWDYIIFLECKVTSWRQYEGINKTQKRASDWLRTGSLWLSA